MKVLTEDTIFYVSYWRRDCHSKRSSQSHSKVTVAAWRAKVVPSFFSYFKTPGIDAAPGIEHVPDGPPALQSSTLPTELILMW